MNQHIPEHEGSQTGRLTDPKSAKPEGSVFWSLSLFAYQALIGLVGPLYLAVRFLRGKSTPGISERLARYPKPLQAALETLEGPIWIHLVSVGEVLAAGPFIQEMRRRLPHKRWVLTTTTPTGRSVAQRLIRPGQDQLLYLPWDFLAIVHRALEAIRPSLFLVFETELWPVLFHCLEKRGVPIVLLNGRLSPSAYRRYLWIRPFMERALEPVSLFFAQSIQDARRYAAIGAAKDRVVAVGNLKWDLTGSESGNGSGENRFDALFKPLPSTLLWTAGSTHPGEEKILLSVYKRLKEEHSELKLLIAPRHPERIPEVEQEVLQAGLKPVRRSALKNDAGQLSSDGADCVILLDTLGELTAVYQVSDLVFVGGSLVPHGGHNLVEPAAFRRPILTGPHLQNFRAISEALFRAGGLVVVRSAQELEERIRKLLAQPGLRRQLGQRAYGVIQEHRGATQRTVEAILLRWGNELKA